jgi:hypothetical protein
VRNVALAPSMTEPEHPVLACLSPVMRADLVLNHIRGDGRLWAGNEKVAPSGLDALACAYARSVLASPRSVAIALPRGRGSLPVMLGIYLATARVIIGRSAGGICGSVAVSTTRTELRDLGRQLRFYDRTLQAAIPVAQLVTEPLASKRVRAAALTLAGRDRKGLSQSDAYLLFMMPNRMPPVALNVISAMVCDTYGASEGSWQTTHERNVAARRRQVWLGELGDADYERFCAERDIPLLRLDWPLIAASTRAHGLGAAHLASTPLAARALSAPPVGYRVVADRDVDEELRLLTFALAEMRRRGRTEAPDAMRDAGQLANILTRLACPVECYDQAVASHPMSRKVAWLLERITDASSANFRNRYKQAFEQHWTTVRGAAKELVRTLSEPERNPKYWAVAERISDIQYGQRIRVLCQTRAERDALRSALLSAGLITQEDLDRGSVRVESYTQRDEHGPAEENVITLLCSPPPPAKAALYLSGEDGQVEVLCYPFEVGRLRSALRRVHGDYAGDAHNAAALATLGMRTPASGTQRVAGDPAELLVELPGYGERAEESPAAPETEPKLPDADAGFWESAPALYDSELALDDPDEREPAGPGSDGASGRARLLSFLDGPPMYLAEDADCTVVVAPTRAGEEPDIRTLHPGELSAGMRIALLPGSERGGLLADLMAYWDEGIALVRGRYEPMYYRALLAAIAAHGFDGVAAAVRLTPDAVRAWRDRRAWPGSAATLRRLLELAGNEEALRNQALIQDYFTRVRNAHRHIGRVLNDAVGETVLHDRGRDSIPKLEALVGRPLTELFDATSVLTVQRVGAPETVPAGVCGSFLDPDDPYLKAKGVTP